MSALLAVILGAALNGSGPLAVEVTSVRDALAVSVRLLEPLPAPMESALPSGAVVRIRYPLRVRSERRLWWDRKIFRGEMIVTASFDPLTGRYRCELALDEVIVDGAELGSADAALEWLRAPPTVRLALPAGRRPPRLKIRARAVYSTSTTWLVFPSVEGTDWVEIPLSLSEEPADGPHDG